MHEEAMKVLIVSSLCIAVALALACENLGERALCNSHSQEGDCSCQAGLSCVLTKKMIFNGGVTLVKQCMPEHAAIVVETIDFQVDKEKHPSPAFVRVSKRGIGMFTKCSSESDCARNFCCPPNAKLCLPKILENFACNFDELYQCGCQEGLVCKKTADISIVPGINVELKQCLKQ